MSRKHDKCTNCNGSGVDMSEVTDPETLKTYTDRGMVPVGCCNPDCDVQPDWEEFGLNKETIYIIDGREGQWELTSEDNRECFFMDDTDKYEYFVNPEVKIKEA